MLHRSPSGAARRIRQRREENSQRQFPILSSPNSPATFNKSPSNETSKETMIDGDNNTTNESLQMDYRDLMNSSSYKSILPDDDFNISYSRPPQRILCNSTSISPHASKMESSTEESLQPEITSFSNGSQQYPEVNQHTITMESNKFLDKVDFSTLLSSTSNVIPPVPPKRSSLASSFGDTSSHTSITNNNKPLNQKPTIQVHPMPAPRKHSLRCDDSSDEISPSSTLEKNYKKIPPPIPKKPAKFMFKTNNDSPILFNPSEPYYHIHSVSSPVPPSPVPRSADPYKEHSVMRQRFDSLPSLGSSQPQGNNKENERNNECETKESTYNNLFVKNQSSYLLSASTSNLFSSNLLSSSISSAQSTESLNQLFTSPSMLSLQNAYKNCQLMNEQELETLEEKRKGLIESLSRKIRVLDQEKIMIDEDIIENENFKMLLFKKIDLDPQMLIRLNNHISQAKTLILLESKVNLQLEKLENYLINNNDTMEPSIYEFCQFRKNRLIEQLSDSSMLRNLHRSRDVEIENILSSKYFLQDQMKEWRFYKDSLVRLLTEKRQMEDRLSQARHQLAALDSLSIQADALMKSLSITNNHTRDISSDGSSSMISDHSGGNTLDRRDINVDELRNDNTISNSNNSTTVTV
uniref:ASD2 domain-containing protein n=1 Tax=Parastrongyloides trichosuri TaxID=131310 RepID=A0A0N4ZV67_PARTI